MADTVLSSRADMPKVDGGITWPAKALRIGDAVGLIGSVIESAFDRG